MVDKRKSFEPELGIDDRQIAFIPADPVTAKTLTAEQVQHYNDHGYVTGLTPFDDDRSAELAAYFDNLITEVVNAPDARNGYSINLYQLVCQGVYDVLVEPVILDYVADILGPDFVCWGSHLFCKLPGDPKEVPLHQDATYWPFTPTHSVTGWLAVDDVDEENSAMQFAPGSHLLGALPHTDHGLDGTRVLGRAVDHAQQWTERISNNLRRGQLSLHSDLLLHGSTANSSNRRRAGFTMRYAAADVTTVGGWEHWLKPAIHCRGQIPEWWGHLPRPEGEQPELMAKWAGDFDGEPLPDAN
jgi:hypothetical protein